MVVPLERVILNRIFECGVCEVFSLGTQVFPLPYMFMDVSEWIGILSSDVLVLVMDLSGSMCFGHELSELVLIISY